jgi:hypothetical protein
MPVSFLATRSSAPTTDDVNKAFRIVKYLAGIIDKSLVFGKPIGRLQPEFYFDASHGLYPDGYGRKCTTTDAKLKAKNDDKIFIRVRVGQR